MICQRLFLFSPELTGWIFKLPHFCDLLGVGEAPGGCVVLPQLGHEGLLLISVLLAWQTANLK